MKSTFKFPFSSSFRCNYTVVLNLSFCIFPEGIFFHIIVSWIIFPFSKSTLKASDPIQVQFMAKSP